MEGGDGGMDRGNSVIDWVCCCVKKGERHVAVGCMKENDRMKTNGDLVLVYQIGG